MTGWRKTSRSLIRVFQLFVIVYLLVFLAVLIFQRRLIYLPTKIPAGVIESVAAGHGFAPWKNPAGELIGWKMLAKTNATASVLIVHGNAGCALSRDYLAQPIHDAADVDVFVLEYPGYGARTGSPNKDSMVAAAVAAFQLLPKNLPKFVVSESIGAGVACELAKAHPQAVAGVHSLLSMHVAVAPLPEARKPAAHAHVYAPGVFVQTFDALRLRTKAGTATATISTLALPAAPVHAGWLPGSMRITQGRGARCIAASMRWR